MKDRKEWDMELMNEFSLFNKDFSWGDEAACKGMPTDMFFPERGNSTTERKAIKELCGGCKVRQQCLDFAIDNFITYGIWGGMTLNERRRYKARAEWAKKSS